MRRLWTAPRLFLVVLVLTLSTLAQRMSEINDQHISELRSVSLNRPELSSSFVVCVSEASLARLYSAMMNWAKRREIDYSI